MFVLARKLKLLKAELKVWNKTVFGDVNQKVELAQTDLDSFQHQLDLTGYTDTLIASEEKAQM